MKKAKFAKGLVQVYTGNGKGKTTAALGLALRAAGHRFKVLIIQFLKGGIAYGELRSAKKLSPYLTILPMGREHFVDKKNPHPLDVRWAKKGWDLAKRSVHSREYQVVILDEIWNGSLKRAFGFDEKQAKKCRTGPHRKVGQTGGPSMC